ncbi:hypothetical protein GA0070604_6132 [Micromonospora eburnea]|uniref:Uncharacterized protein n=2 Tax=Micromonospora eburnea TaxID=227316 RepID=A0A1C6VNP1_9ACTN|nr:DUF6284 family protein [Micromonospora eburnea]SCL67895.1 hypothetical protein GA0070604_6132 [Micromonospora eburnea]
MSYDLFSDLEGPSVDDLAEIEQEMPLIEAEVLLLDAQITVLSAEPAPSDLDWQRVRRAQRRVLREARALLAARAAGPTVSAA